MFLTPQVTSKYGEIHSGDMGDRFPHIYFFLIFLFDCIKIQNVFYFFWEKIVWKYGYRIYIHIYIYPFCIDAMNPGLR